MEYNFEKYSELYRLNYSIYVSANLSTQATYIEFLDYKLNKLHDVLKGNLKIDLPTVNASTYYKYMWKLINVEVSKKFEKDLATIKEENEYCKFSDASLTAYKNTRYDKLNSNYKTISNKLSNLSNYEAEHNIISEKIYIDNRSYSVGTKITKLMSIIGMDEHFYGSIDFNNVKRSQEKVYLSIYPHDMVQAGIIGDSCYSPDGSNSHAITATIRYTTSLIAMNEENTWRAWVYVSPEEKKFFVAKGYPRENYSNQISIIRYFIDVLGYKPARLVRSDSPAYLDSQRVDGYTTLCDMPINRDANETEADYRISVYSWEQGNFAGAICSCAACGDPYVDHANHNYGDYCSQDCYEENN